MALLYFDGFESVPSVRSTITSNSTPVSLTGRDGVGRALGIGGSGTSTHAFNPVSGTIIVGFGWFVSAAQLGTTNELPQLSALGAGQIAITLSGSGQVQIRRGTGGGTIIATSTLNLVADAWHYFEVKLLCADAGGLCTVRVDEVEFVTFSGDTRNSGSAPIDAIRFFHTTNGASALDDLVILDATGSAPYNDFIGERVIKAKRPTGNGASSEWGGSDGNSTDNYQLVDDDPVNTTDYVSSNVAGQRDLYDMSAAIGLNSVDAVQVVTYASKSDSGVRSFKPLLRSSVGTVDEGATQALSTSWASYYAPIELTNPDGSAWTPVNVNTIQAGVETV